MFMICAFINRSNDRRKIKVTYENYDAITTVILYHSFCLTMFIVYIQLMS